MNFGTFFFTISSVTNFMPIEIARQKSSSSRLKPQSELFLLGGRGALGANVTHLIGSGLRR